MRNMKRYEDLKSPENDTPYLTKEELASELWGIHRPDWENDLWFPNK